MLCATGYSGPIGILGHTDDDAEERLAITWTGWTGWCRSSRGSRRARGPSRERRSRRRRLHRRLPEQRRAFEARPFIPRP